MSTVEDLRALEKSKIVLSDQGSFSRIISEEDFMYFKKIPYYQEKD